MERKKVNEDELVNCLTDETIIVRFVPKESGIKDPKHILYGGMAKGVTRNYTVPMLQNGRLVNVLTDSEKRFLEDKMGLEYNALSIYNKTNNYWSNYSVRLERGDNYLDLKEPEDFIRYKVLLANKDYIAHSIAELEEKPKATYQFVIVRQGDEKQKIRGRINIMQDCFVQFGKFKDDKWALKTIIESIGGRHISDKTSIEDMQTQTENYILASPKLFHAIVTDESLAGKVLLRKSVSLGLVSNKGGYYYLKDGNVPLCENNQDPDLKNASKFLLSARNQEMKLKLETETKDK